MKKYIKTERTFSFIRKYAYLLTLLVALGGLYEPKLGLLVVFIMLGLIVTSFFKGRYWCGNICPHGSLFDRVILPLSRNREIPEIFKSKAFILLVFTGFLYKFTGKFIDVFKFFGDYSFFEKLGAVFSTTYLMVFLVGSLLGLFINPRTWCQFCPMGSLQKISYKAGDSLGLNKNTEERVTISDTASCLECGKCEKVCPFQIEVYKEFNEHMQLDNPNCIKCKTCVVNCPIKILSMEKRI